MPVNLTALPQIREWAAGTADFNPAAFVMSTMSVAEAAVLSTLLWPDFVEYEAACCSPSSSTKPASTTGSTTSRATAKQSRQR
ncbi:hypothetical protein GCM10027269_65890 [Kribbella endophytica]